jgi:hypothetical protein
MKAPEATVTLVLRPDHVSRRREWEFGNGRYAQSFRSDAETGEPPRISSLDRKEQHKQISDMKTSRHKLSNIRQTSIIALTVIVTATLITTSRAQTSSSPPSSGDAALTKQIADLQAKVHQLEATISSHSQQPGASGSMPGMQAGGGMRGMGNMQGMQPGGGMGGMEGMQNMMGTMEGMDMMGMMSGMQGMQGMNMPQSALPGFPGASHIYHIGATGFFLDHAEHISLSADEQVGLNKIKDHVLASKAASDRQIEQAEQELATLTSADQPDLKKIEAKVRDIAKLGTDQRIAFIKAVGDAAKLLTDDQRKILTGFASPAPAASPPPMPSMSPMSDM